MKRKSVYIFRTDVLGRRFTCRREQYSEMRGECQGHAMVRRDYRPAWVQRSSTAQKGFAAGLPTCSERRSPSGAHRSCLSVPNLSLAEPNQYDVSGSVSDGM